MCCYHRQKIRMQAAKIQGPAISQRSPNVYAWPIFLSAFLLFLVQPMLAKVILPWFGGVASVWVVAMLFFQGMLLVGYTYAYAIVRYLPTKAQPLCHVTLLAGSLLLMPIAPWHVWQHGAPGDPALQILRVLLLSAGFPYFLLSTTGPLIQAWYAQSHRVAFPYRLFALSNLGSLAALLAYPFTIEPFISTRHQVLAWSCAYGVFAVLCIVAATHFWRSHPEPLQHSEKGKPAPPPRRQDYLLWAALAACGSALLVTVMNHLCQNVMPMPLLWVLPLSTYLLTFILCFDRHGWYRPGYLRWLAPAALGVMMYGVFNPLGMPEGATQIPIYLGCLFVCCMFCHGELAHRKPHSRHLTSYYLMIAAGGSAGSVAIGLIAPRVSSWQVEFPETLLVCGLLALTALYPKHWARRAAQAALIAALVLMAAGLVRPRRNGVVLLARSFYGSLSVTEENRGSVWAQRVFRNGWIMHGTQLLSPQYSNAPTTYYGPHSGAGLVLTARHNPWRVGVVGLGAGTLAAYGRPGDFFRFYEIDPLVAQVAANQFTYLKSTPATVDIKTGDGRLSLEKEPAGQFNLLAIDAFSGDFVPTHLLTREAFELYFSKLKPDGLLAVHVSSKFIDLKPLLASVSAVLHKKAVLIQNAAEDAPATVYSEWVLIGDASSELGDLPPAILQPLPPAPPGFEVWTDDYSNVVQLFK
jgi:hypothetical protein